MKTNQNEIKQSCANCWHYSNSLERCMITQIYERPEQECEIGMFMAKPGAKKKERGKNE